MPDNPPSPQPIPQKVRHLVIVLGDQLNAEAAALQGFDTEQDVVWMAEVAEESPTSAHPNTASMCY